MQLSHYSREPIALADLKRKEQGGERGYFKPRGLWVSVCGEDDWKSWCEAEQFGLDRLAVESAVTLRPDANVLLLPTVGAMLGFHREFGFKPYPEMAYPMFYIDWPRVAERWDGVIIAPYQWSQRLDGECHDWYYSWDCASGCIWHPRAIADIRQIQTESESLRADCAEFVREARPQ